MSKVKVLFVCLGNICRSPLAEGVFRHLIEQRKMTHLFDVESCGTAAFHIGELPDKRSVDNARQNGVNYTHSARQFKQVDHYKFDVILPMDESNRKDVEAIKPRDGTARVIKMRYFDVEDKNADVPDPYYGGQQGFQNVYEIVYRSCKRLLETLIKQYHLEND